MEEKYIKKNSKFNIFSNYTFLSRSFDILIYLLRVLLSIPIDQINIYFFINALHDLGTGTGTGTLRIIDL